MNDANLICNCVTHFGTVPLIFDPIIFLEKGLDTMNPKGENGNLHKLFGALKQKFGLLTEDDSLINEGQKQEEFGNLQIRIGNTENDLFKIIDEL